MKKYTDNFEELYSDNEVYLLSKDEFEHNEGELSFKYRYAITIIDMEEITGEDLPVTVELSLIVSPESITKDRIRDIAYTNGMEDEEDYTPSFLDTIMDGTGITFKQYAVENVEGEMLEDDKVLGIVGDMNKEYHALDSMRGFYLDKPWNRIGTTGWDMVEHLVLGEELFKF